MRVEETKRIYYYVNEGENVLLDESKCIVINKSAGTNWVTCTFRCSDPSKVVKGGVCIKSCESNEVADLDTVCRTAGTMPTKKPDYYCDVMLKNNVWLVEEPCALKQGLTSQNSDIINVYELYYDAAQKAYRLLSDPTGEVAVSNVIFNIKAEVPSYTTVDLLSGYTLTNVKFTGTLCTDC